MIKKERMTKRILGAAAMLMTVAMLGGCGAAKEQPLHELDTDKYVTLGDYTNLEVAAELQEVDETEWNQWLANIYAGYATAELGAVDRAIIEGDTANIDYEGKLDGVAFDGGTAQGTNLTIGSGTFIEGFEEGLVGVNPGETVDLPLTFPASYGNTDLAGKEVVFTVKVNYVIPGNEEDMLDAVVSTMAMEEFSDIAGLKQYLYDLLVEDAQSTYDSERQNQILDQLLEQSTFEELPEYLVETYKTYMNNNLEATAQSYGATVDAYTSYYFGMTQDDFVNTYVEDMLKQDLVLQAIANKENLTVDDEELETTLQTYATESGYSTVDEFIGDISRDEYRNYLMNEKVFEFLLEQ